MKIFDPRGLSAPVPGLNTSFPLKPLDQSKPNFMWSLLGKGGKKVNINGPGHMTKMTAMPIYGKNLQKNPSQEPEVL